MKEDALVECKGNNDGETINFLPKCKSQWGDLVMSIDEKYLKPFSVKD